MSKEKKTTSQRISETFFLGSAANYSEDDTGPDTESPEETASTTANETTVFETSEPQDLTKHEDEELRSFTATAASPNSTQANPYREFLVTPYSSPARESKKARSISPGLLSASSFAKDPYKGWSIEDWIRTLKKRPYLLEEAPLTIKNPVIIFSIINQVPELYTKVQTTYNEQARIQLNIDASIIEKIPIEIKENISFLEEIFSDSTLKRNLAIIISALHSNLEAKAHIDQEFQKSDIYLKAALQEEILYKTLPDPLQKKAKKLALMELKENLSDTKLEQIYKSLTSSIQTDAQFFYSFLETIEAQIKTGQTGDNNLYSELEKIIQSIELGCFDEAHKQQINAKIIRLYSFDGSREYQKIWYNSSGTFRWSSDELNPILKDIMFSTSFWQVTSREDSLKQLRTTALNKDGLVLGLFPKADRANEALVFNAVSQNGLALEFASDALRKNHAIVFTAIQNKLASRFISSSSLKALADKIIFLQEIAEKEDKMIGDKALELVKQIQEYVIARPETEEALVKLFEQYHNSENNQMTVFNLEFAFKLHRLIQHKGLEPQASLPLIETFHKQYQSSNEKVIQLIEALDETNNWLNGQLETKDYQQFAENLAKDPSLGMKALGVAILVFASLLILSGITVATTGMGVAAGAGICTLGVSIAALQVGFFSKKAPLSPLREQISALAASKLNNHEREKETTARLLHFNV